MEIILTTLYEYLTLTFQQIIRNEFKSNDLYTCNFQLKVKKTILRDKQRKTKYNYKNIVTYLFNVENIIFWSILFHYYNYNY